MESNLCLFLRIQASDLDLDSSHRPIGSCYGYLCLCFENQSSFVKMYIMTSLKGVHIRLMFCKGLGQGILNVVNAKPDRLKQMQSTVKNSPARLHTSIPPRPPMKANFRNTCLCTGAKKSTLRSLDPPPTPPQRRSAGVT